jgi:cysteine-rich repeat protein
MRAFSIVVGVVAAASLAACGDNIKLGTPGPEGPEGPSIACGDGVVQAGEDCDDADAAKDNVCDATCRFTCGNGVVDVDVGEQCDTAIASGPGACPATCDDGAACTDDALNSSGCTAACVHAPIIAAADGDRCCPPGADANTDSDCAAICGNGVLEAGETCDSGIMAGAGACPTACDDALVCTTDVLTSAGTCQAACSFPPITTPAGGDGCCPAGANATTDGDCLAVCGNGVVEPSETCDIGIASGAGACPTTCQDGVACTADTLGNAGTCQAVCVFPPITTPASGDGCCPPGANATTDGDCTPVCGNTVVEPGEQCDDGNANNKDACANNCRANPSATAFRFADLDLRDPHVFTAASGCKDVTDNKQLGFSLNDVVEAAIKLDGNGDGRLDLSPTLVFRQFSQTTPTTPVELQLATCSAPTGSSSCMASGSAVMATTATNLFAGQCLTSLPGTVHPYAPSITSPSASCFVTSPAAMTLDLRGIAIPLQDAQVAAHYVGFPADTLANGLIRGFLSEADAAATIVPISFPVVGGRSLGALLAGGAGACPSFSDRDTHNGAAGWWVYLNFSGNRISWTE